MGLPELTFSLKKAADNVAARVSSGIVAMILRDAKANASAKLLGATSQSPPAPRPLFLRAINARP